MSLPSGNGPSPDFAKSELVGAFTGLLVTGEGYDLTVTCNGFKFKTHRAILASRSEFFRSACWGTYEDVWFNTIDLPDEDPSVVKKVLEYLYTLNYEVDKDFSFYIANVASLGRASPATGLDTNHIGSSSTQSGVQMRRKALQGILLRQVHDFDDPLALIMQHSIPLHIRSIQYDKERLPVASEAPKETLHHQERGFDDTKEHSMKQESTPGIESSQHGSERPVMSWELAVHAMMYVVGHIYVIQGLKSTAAQKMAAALQVVDWKRNPQAKMEDFTMAVALAYSIVPQSDKGLRAVMVRSVKKHMKRLLKVPEFAEIVEFTPQFAADLLDGLA